MDGGFLFRPAYRNEPGSESGPAAAAEDGVPPEGIGVMKDGFRTEPGEDHFHDIEADRDVRGTQ